MPWYGLMYIIAFVLVRAMIHRRRPLVHGWPPDPARLDTILVWAMVGAVLGGRAGYVLFYEPTHYLTSPGEIFQLWRGGMSFHGGLIGVGVIVRLAAGSDLFRPLLDCLAFWSPWGLALGRLGNFLNGELWGRISDRPWAMVFAGAGDLPRHPTQLYEALWEGPALWLCLYVYSRRGSPRPGRLAGLWAIVYSLGRLAVELLREPHPASGYLAWGWLTLGQILSLILLAVGLWFFFAKTK